MQGNFNNDNKKADFKMSDRVKIGLEGESAYEIWLKITGNEDKTEQEFLDSLVGNGIESIIFNSDNTITITYTDGTIQTTNAIDTYTKSEFDYLLNNHNESGISHIDIRLLINNIVSGIIEVAKAAEAKNFNIATGTIKTTFDTVNSSITTLNNLVQGLKGASVPLGQISENNADITQLKLNNYLLTLSEEYHTAQKGYVVYDLNDHEWEHNGSIWVDNGIFVNVSASNTQLGSVIGNEYVSILNGVMTVLKSLDSDKLGGQLPSYYLAVNGLDTAIIALDKYATKSEVTTLLSNKQDAIYNHITYIPIDGNIQTYIDVATPGDTLILASGTYTITASIKVDRSLTIKGQGINATKISNLTTGNTQIFNITSSNVNLSNLDIAFIGESVTGININSSWLNIRIENINITATGTGVKNGMVLSNTSAYVNNCNIDITSSNSSAFGIQIAAKTVPTIKTISNTNIKVTGAYSAGIYIADATANELLIINLYSIYCIAQYGISCVSGSDVSSLLNAYNCTFNGSIQDVSESGTNTINLYNCTLVNNTVLGTVNYLGNTTDILKHNTLTTSHEDIRVLFNNYYTKAETRPTYHISDGSIDYDNQSADGIYYDSSSEQYNIFDIKTITIDEYIEMISQELFMPEDGYKLIRYGYRYYPFNVNNIVWFGFENGNFGYLEIATSKNTYTKTEIDTTYPKGVANGLATTNANNELVQPLKNNLVSFNSYNTNVISSTATADSTTDTITSGHGLSLTAVTAISFSAGSGVLPTGILAEPNYYYTDLASITANTFKVSNTFGGATIDITANGTTGWAFRKAGVLNIPISGLDLNTDEEYVIEIIHNNVAQSGTILGMYTAITFANATSVKSNNVTVLSNTTAYFVQTTTNKKYTDLTTRIMLRKITDGEYYLIGWQNGLGSDLVDYSTTRAAYSFTLSAHIFAPNLTALTIADGNGTAGLYGNGAKVKISKKVGK